MNHTYKMLLAAGALVVGVQQGQAVTWSDAQNPGVYMATGGAADAGPGSGVINGTFDIVSPGTDAYVITAPYPGITAIADDVTPGFTPGFDSATSATAFFWFRDTNDPAATESVAVTLDGDAFSGGAVTSEGVSVFGGVADVVATINTSGTVSYQVTASSGDFFFDYALLTVNGEPGRDNGVPDGGATAGLLGLGMIGVAALRRKLS